MPNEGRVYFRIRGDFEPSYLTEQLGIESTSAAALGSKDASRIIPRCSSWDFSSEPVVGEIVDVYEMSEVLIGRLEPFTERIREVTSRLNCSCVLQVVLHISMDDSLSTPSIGFSRGVLKFLDLVGATIDIDTYRAD